MQGGGIFRPTYLIKTEPVRFQDDGIFVRTFATSAITPKSNAPSDGITADSRIIPSVTTEFTTPVSVTIRRPDVLVNVSCALLDVAGVPVGSVTAQVCDVCV